MSEPLENTEPNQPSPAPPAVNPHEQFELPNSDFDDELDGPVPSEPAAPAAEKPPVPSAPAEKPKHSKRLIRMATDLGIPQGDIDTMPTEQLDELVYHLNRQLLTEREYSRQQQQSSVPPGAGSVAPPSVPKAEGESFDLGLDESEFDPRLIAAMKKLHTTSAEKIKSLEDELGKARAADAQRHRQTVEQRIDQTIADLKDYSDKLGSGPLHTMTKDSAEFGRRVALWGEAQRLAGQNASLEAVLAKMPTAAVNLFGAKQPVEDEPALDSRKEAWQRGNLARPTYREHQEPKGARRAAKAVAEKMRAAGRSPEGDEQDDLPD